MIPYLFILAFTSVFSLSESSRYSALKGRDVALYSYFLFVLLFVGLRYQVGSDWGGYLRILEYTVGLTYFESLSRSEFSYITLNWISTNVLNYRAEGGIWFVNLVCAVISTYALYKFCAWQNRPWLTAYIVSSYLLVVIVIGLTRQGVAVSLVCLALVYLFQGRVLAYFLTIIFATSFHVSAIILLPALVLGKEQKTTTYIFVGLVFLLATIYFSYSSFQDTLDGHYFDRELNSGGAMARFVFHISAAMVFLAYRKRFRANSVEIRFYTAVSLAAFLMLALLFVSPSTTFVDRMAFYLVPLQLFAFSNLPNVIYRNNSLSAFALVVVMLLFLAKFTVWITNGTTVDRFLPYQSFLFVAETSSR